MIELSDESSELLHPPRDWRLWCRIKTMFWEGETALAEQVVAVGGFLRGAWMCNPHWSSIPPEVQGNLIPRAFPEWVWGVWVMSLGILQFFAAGRRGPRVRWTVATIFAATQGSAAIGYWRADLFFRGVVPFIVAMALVELWVSWRARFDRRVARYLEERRDVSADIRAP